MADGFIVKRGGGDTKQVESIRTEGLDFSTTPLPNIIRSNGYARSSNTPSNLIRVNGQAYPQT